MKRKSINLIKSKYSHEWKRASQEEKMELEFVSRNRLPFIDLI